jgi:sRNA-binding regulator protein Hfq
VALSRYNPTMAGKGGKRNRPGGRRGGPPRRKVPPDATGEETTYFQQVKDRRTPLIVHLVTGQKVEGVIEYFDRDMIKVTRPAGPHFFVRKDDIRYVEEAED